MLGPDAVVRGHAVAIFGSVRAAPGARVEGRMIGLASLAGLAVEPATDDGGPRLRMAVRLLTAGAWLLATTLIAFLWPARIRYGVSVLPQLGFKVAVLGGMVAVTLVAALIAAIGLGPLAGPPLAALLAVAFLAVKARRAHGARRGPGSELCSTGSVPVGRCRSPPRSSSACWSC